MATELDDIEALFHAVKALRDERRKMEKLSQKSSEAPIGKSSRRTNADLTRQAFHVMRLEHTAHAAAVNAGIADMRPASEYAPYAVKLNGFHEYKVVPQTPRGIS